MPGRVVWIDSVVDSSISSGGVINVDLTVDYSNEQTRAYQMTLMRTIVRLDLAAVVHDAGEGSQKMGMGFGIISQEAFGAGVLPDPQTQGDFPPRGWIYRGIWRTYSFQAGVADVHVRPVDLDLRSRRKLENGLCFMIVDNLPVEGTATSMRVTGIVRQLWLMS